MLMNSGQKLAARKTKPGSRHENTYDEWISEFRKNSADEVSFDRSSRVKNDGVQPNIEQANRYAWSPGRDREDKK